MVTSRVATVEVVGPLEPYQATFEDALSGLGYTPLSAVNQLRLMKHLSIWLEERDLDASDLTDPVIAVYLSARRESGYTSWLSPKALSPLLACLRGLGVAPAPVTPTPANELEKLIDRYRCYLEEQRGLVQKSVALRVRIALLFLDPWVDASGRLQLKELAAADVTTFVAARCRDVGVATAKNLAMGLRMLLRFLMLDGLTRLDLSGAVPPVANWRGGALPRYLSAAEVQALLQTCDRTRCLGRRNLAILKLLVRLGLRACEVARLQLEDFDWRRGEVIIRGKADRDERLPVPGDVGEAVVDYLRGDNNRRGARHVFVSANAPYRPLSRMGVQQVVWWAGVKAGLGHIGTHRLRHTAATQTLRAGAPLVEVGQLLRHRSPQNTALYGKVDQAALRQVALPWPGVAA